MQTAPEHIDYKVLYEQSLVEIAYLKHELAILKQLVYGSKNERFVPTDKNVHQTSMGFETDTATQSNTVALQKIEYTRAVKPEKPAIIHPGRTKLPEHLERRIQIIEPAEDITELKKIGEEITEELEYEPGKLFVNKFVRPKYAQTSSEGIIIAPMVERPLPKAIAGPGLLAQIIIDKYVDHLPLYRQEQRFKREGVNIPYNTISDWIKNGCTLLDPLGESLRKIVIQSDYLHADETPLKVLDKNKKGTTHRGYFWVYHNSIDDLVWFDYQESRGREGPHKMLKDFKGYLQTDGYQVYDIFKENKDINVLHCMAHARRKFFEAKDNDLPNAEYALEQIGLLYAIERKAKDGGLTPDEVFELRQVEALPILKSLGKWMKETYLTTLPKSTIGKALAYSIERWPELMMYASNGKLNIDNNPVENSIRPVAIGRKNYLFAGNHEAAQRSAMLYSLVGTCKLNGINPFIWLRDVITRISTHSINKIDELLPQNWMPNTNG